MHWAGRNFSSDFYVHLDFRIEIGRVSIKRHDGVRVFAPRVDCVVAPLERLNRMMASREHLTFGGMRFSFLKRLHSSMPDCLAFLVIEAFDPETAKAWMLGGCEIKTEEHYMATCDNVGGQSIFLFAISHGQFLLESLVDSSLEAC